MSASQGIQRSSNQSEFFGSALVTGANSGIGFECAAQLASAGTRRVIVACRSEAKAKSACTELAHRTGLEVFEPLVVDVTELTSVRASVDRLVGKGRLDLLVLNAGVLPGAEVVLTSERIESTSAASLVGHHALTMLLLRAHLLEGRARIVIAGSEGARGDAPGMKPIDLARFGREHCGGDLERAVHAWLTMTPPATHHWSTTYCTAKLFVALWARALSRRLPEGLAVHAVSPGNVPATRAARHQPWYFRTMMRVACAVGPTMGMASTAAVGARRYLDASMMPASTSGSFLASPRGKLVGPLTTQDLPQVTAEAAEACFRALVSITREGID